MSQTASTAGQIRPVYARRRLKAIAARWDARADSWDRALETPGCCFNEDDAYRRFTRAVQRLIAQRRSFCARQGVIDVGCGTGLVLADALPAFAWGIGIDISPKMIRLARAKRVAKAKFLVGDGFRLPALCPPAGAVLSRGVLLSHYGREQGREMLAAARAILVPHGVVVFDFLNETARARYPHAPENKSWFTGEEMRSLAGGVGFSRCAISGRPQRRVLLLVAQA